MKYMQAYLMDTPIKKSKRLHRKNFKHAARAGRARAPRGVRRAVAAVVAAAVLAVVAEAGEEHAVVLDAELERLLDEVEVQQPLAAAPEPALARGDAHVEAQEGLGGPLRAVPVPHARVQQRADADGAEVRAARLGVADHLGARGPGVSGRGRPRRGAARGRDGARRTWYARVTRWNLTVASGSELFLSGCSRLASFRYTFLMDRASLRYVDCSSWK